MAKWKVTIKGIGKLGNSPKMINEVFEIDESANRDLSNSNKKEDIIKGLLFTRLPGVEFETNKLGINREEIRESIIKNETVRNIGKSVIAGAIGGALANKSSKRPKKSKAKVKDYKEEIIESFAHELNHLHNISFTEDLKDTELKLDEIYYGVKPYKWKFARDGLNKVTVTENNRSLTKCLSKYEHGLKILSNSSEDENIIKDYKTKFKKLKLKKILNKFGLVIGLVVLFFVLILLASILD